MNTIDIDKKIAVMTAFKEGKKIECKIIDPAVKDDWKEIAVPAWNWGTCDYRVKEEPKYRPYASASELLADVKKHGAWVKCKDGYNQIISIASNCIGTDSADFDYMEIVKNWCWADDNTPCGKLNE